MIKTMLILSYNHGLIGLGRGKDDNQSINIYCRAVLETLQR